jgi:general secretion pathway protein K
VLVTLLFTAYALIAFSEKASNDLLVEARAATARRLRAKAYSTLEVVLAVLSEFRQASGGLRSPAEGWGDPLAFANWEPGDGCTAEVTFTDESGKLSLPHVDYATLVQLFVSWDLPQVDAEGLADALMVWMRRDYISTQAVTNAYDRGELPYHPPQRPLRSYAELAAIDPARALLYDEGGRPNALWHRFVSALSLFDFAQTNINGTSGDVLTALGSYDATQQQQLGDYLAGKGSYARQGPAFVRSTGEAAALLGGDPGAAHRGDASPGPFAFSPECGGGAAGRGEDGDDDGHHGRRRDAGPQCGGSARDSDEGGGVAGERGEKTELSIYALGNSGK